MQEATLRDTLLPGVMTHSVNFLNLIVLELSKSSFLHRLPNWILHINDARLFEPDDTSVARSSKTVDAILLTVRRAQRAFQPHAPSPRPSFQALQVASLRQGTAP